MSSLRSPSRTGLADIINRTHAQTDDINLTGITDAVVPANNQTFAYTATNRMNVADGPQVILGAISTSPMTGSGTG